MLQDGRLETREPANDIGGGESAHEGHSEVGSILKRTRAQSGYTLEQISQALNIRLQHLAAIEESRFDDLPGVPYAVGFVKAYSNFLGLDDYAVVARYKEEIQVIPGTQRLVFPEPVDEARVPKGTLIAVSLLAALAIYGVWYFVSSYNSIKMVTVPEVPDRVAPDSVGPKSILPAVARGDGDTAEETDQTASSEATPPAPVETGQKVAANAMPPVKTEPAVKAEPPVKTGPVAETPTPVAVPAPVVTASAEPAEEADDADAEGLPAAPTTVTEDGQAQPDQTVAMATPPAPTEAVQAAAAPAPAVTDAASATDSSQDVSEDATADATPVVEEPHVPKTYGSASTDVRIVLKAGADSWVQVETSDQEVLLSRVLKAGDSYRVPNRQGLVMMTGNAGALDIMVDGRSIGSLGPLGAVRRGVALAPEALSTQPATARN